MKICHIVAHLGGGIGAVIKNLILNDGNEHLILSLNPDEVRAVKIANTFDNLKNDYPLLNAMVMQSDIVILHWVNNVLLYDLLIRNGLPECRLLIWAHANNLYSPYVIPPKLIDICDRFILTSGVTYESLYFEELTREQKDKFDIIWSVADMSDFKRIKKIEHQGFNIGYAGTIDFNSKLHPDFVDLCAGVNIPDIKFIVCSGGPDLEKLKHQVHDKGLADKFIFTGRVEDLTKWFAQMDVFGYPLYEKHYGTCEQVLGEAMAAGLVPIVLDNPPERYIIKNNENGIITDIEHYARKIEQLYEYKSLRDTLSIKAKHSAEEIYNTKQMIKKWNFKFVDSMHTNKKERKWPWTGAEIFKESLGKYSRPFEKNIMDIVEVYRENRQWKSASKGSIYQYSDHYPEDDNLKAWRKIADESK